MSVSKLRCAIAFVGLLVMLSGPGLPGALAQEPGVTFYVSPIVRPQVVEEIRALVGQIVAFQRRDLGEALAEPVDARIFGSRREILDALIDQFGYSQERAAAAVARSGFLALGHTILIDGGSALFLDPPRLADRAGVVAHELAHIFHNDLMGGSRPAQVWIREGFAVRMELRTLEALALHPVSGATEQLNLTVFAFRRGELIPLVELGDSAGWAGASERVGPDRVYGQSFAAVDYLVRTRTLQATFAYFRAFRESRNEADNFRKAFGVDVQAFQEEFEQYLATLVR